jgi:prolyl oligopeptidase
LGSIVPRTICADIAVLLLLTGLAPADGLTYPPARICDQVDDFFGTLVADPYRWLEDVDSQETRSWIAAENQLTESFLSAIPYRDELRARLRELNDYACESMPGSRRGDRYFFYTNTGLQEHWVYCCRDGLDGEPVVLIDPNTFPPEDNLALAGTSVSDDGRYLAWGLSGSGSDWVEWYVTDIETGQLLPDTLRWTKADWVAWNADDTGFYYSRLAEPEPGTEYTALSEAEQVYVHLVGTPQEQDSLVYARPDHPEWFPSAYLTEDHRYMILSIYDGSSLDYTGIFYVDLHLPPDQRQLVELLSNFDASYSLIGTIGDDFFVQTNLGAPNYRIVSIDLDYPDSECWRDVVPEQPEPMSGASLMDDSRTLVVQYTRDACSEVRFHAIDGTFQKTLELPAPGTVWGFSGRQAETEAFYEFSSFLYPGVIYRYDFLTGESTEIWRPEIPADILRFESREVFYTSYDGTRVPMFLVYPLDMPRDGTSPALMTGYGGFGISMSPYFSTSVLLWLERGGVYAMPCIRGGGEYGEEWHLAGVGVNRINVWDDFICAAEYLIDSGYTSTAKLAIEGGSNGGTLMGCVLNRRPDLFGAVVAGMGVMDLLRYHLFTYGWSWIPEFGDPEDPEDFMFLQRYSPYHNIVPGIDYPAVLVTTADHDDRVVPGHSFKYAARLQAAQTGEEPVLISIYPDAGHGGSVGLTDALDRTADTYAFLLEVLGQ